MDLFEALTRIALLEKRMKRLEELVTELNNKNTVEKAVEMYKQQLDM